MMPETRRACPKCGQEFELTEALSGRLKDHLREELLGEITRREAEMAEKSERLAAPKDALRQERDALDEAVVSKVLLGSRPFSGV